MGVRVAYGNRSKIAGAIASGVIPRDSLIITDDAADSEMFFYDVHGNMRKIADKRRFETLTEAEEWVKTYDCTGQILSVQNGSDWIPYTVSSGGQLVPVSSATVNLGDIKAIDGGTAGGI